MSGGHAAERRQFVQGPTRPHRGIGGIDLSCQQALAAGVGDHGAVVRAITRGGVENFATNLPERHPQPLPQLAIGTDATGDYQRIQPFLLQGATALDYQRVDDRQLEGAGNVGAGLKLKSSPGFATMGRGNL